MIGKVYASKFSSPSFTSSTTYSQSPKIKNELKSDIFCKSTPINKSEKFSFVSFCGKSTLTKKAGQAGKMLFTKAVKEYNSTIKKLNVPKEKQTQALFNEITGSFDKISKKLDEASSRLKLGLEETEYAQKANIIGNLYTQMGNLTGNPEYFQKAHSLFEEAADISEKNLIKDQMAYQVYEGNEEAIYKALHPEPEHHAIGFRMPGTPETAAKSNTSSQKLEHIGF